MNKLDILKKGIEHLKKIRKADESITKSLRFLNSDFNYFSFGWIETEYVELLSEAVGDRSGWVSYYVYDCNFGNTPMEVIYKTGKKVKLNTVEKLHDIIITI